MNVETALHSLRVRGAATVLLLLGLGLAACGKPAQPDSRSAAPVVNTQQESFTIAGRVIGIKDGTEINLFLPADFPEQGAPQPLASVKVVNGSFNLSGHMDQPRRAQMQIGDTHTFTPLILENTNYVAELDSSDSDALIVRGGSINEQVYGYSRLPEFVAAVKDERERTQKALAGLDRLNEDAVKAIQKEHSAAMAPVNKIQWDYQDKILQGDAAALVKFFVLGDNYDWERYNPEKRAAMLTAYEQELGAHPDVARERLSRQSSLQMEGVQKTVGVGMAYKDVVAWDIDGNPHKLSDVLAANKLVMLDFWASWCGPCRGEFPHLEKVYREFHDRGFEIFAISMDEDKGAWLKALKEEKSKGDIPWINLVDTQGELSAASAVAYGIGLTGLPSNVLIESGGRIAGRQQHAFELEHAVRAKFENTSDEMPRS
jgi:thiol-disulfide isomerase/thioredoxin